MIFASFEFVFLFLPIYLAAYFLCPPRLRNWPVLLLSWLFYAWWRVDFLLLLVLVTLFTFALARGITAAGLRSAAGRRLLVLGLAGNLGILGYFKYANFGVATVNQLLSAWHAAPLPWTEIILPVGLSFYILQSISYLIDVYRGDVPASRNLLDYAAYKAFFSQLIAGPILRYAEIAPYLQERRHSLALFGRGARRFMTGFAMKVVLADSLSPMVEAIFARPEPRLLEAWAGALAYTLQIFFDFAGYSAMAIGLGLICGFRFPENFRHPYLSGNIQAFWQRWHMTLGRFLRDYLYFALGGNRRGSLRTYGNLFITMVVCGAWHGANWTFLLWGIWHGALLVGHRLWRRHGPGPMPYALANPLLVLAVMLGFVIFRAEDLASAAAMYRGIAGLNGLTLAAPIDPAQWLSLGLALLAVYLPLLLRDMAPPRWAWALLPSLGFLLALLLLLHRAAVPFLYFQF